MASAQPPKSPDETLKDVWAALVSRWGTFAKVLFDPVVLVTTIAILLLIDQSLGLAPSEGQGSAPKALYIVLTGVIAVASSVVGAIIHQKMAEETEGGRLVTRGKSAIRGLKLLALNASAAEKRTAYLMGKLPESDLSKDIVTTNLEEIIGRLNALQEEAINAIEEWQDIIPEANVKTQIGIISSLKHEQTSLSGQINGLQGDLDEAKSEASSNKGEAANLQRALRSKEHELELVQRRLLYKERELETSVLSGLTVRGGPVTSRGISIRGGSDQKRCLNCSSTYDPPPTVKGKCPHCGEDPTVFSQPRRR